MWRSRRLTKLPRCSAGALKLHRIHIDSLSHAIASFRRWRCSRASTSGSTAHCETVRGTPQLQYPRRCSGSKCSAFLEGFPLTARKRHSFHFRDLLRLEGFMCHSSVNLTPHPLVGEWYQKHMASIKQRHQYRIAIFHITAPECVNSHACATFGSTSERRNCARSACELYDGLTQYW